MGEATARDEMIGTMLRGRWRIDARLGTGGMAAVYAATHRNGSRVAVKILRSVFSRDPEVRARFLREGYVANSVGHASAVRVLDDDVTEDDDAFLVMELLEGETLEARRARLGGKLPLAEVYSVGEQLLDLLAAAHQKGIFHRDIKPENLFLTREGSIKVLDFGVAQMRSAGGNVTGGGLMLGTPEFMPPEQAAATPEAIDARSDLWSVGATLFMLVSGQPVHVASTLRDYVIAASSKAARSLSDAAPRAPKPLVAVVDRALSMQKHARWQDAREMQHALRRAYLATHAAPVVPLLDMSDEDRTELEKTEYRPMVFTDVPPPPSSGALVDHTARMESPAAAPRRVLAAEPACAPPTAPARATPSPHVPATGASLASLQGHARDDAPRVSPPRRPGHVAAFAALLAVTALVALELGRASSERAGATSATRAAVTLTAHASSAPVEEIPAPLAANLPEPVATAPVATIAPAAPSAPRATHRAPPRPAPPAGSAASAEGLPDPAGRDAGSAAPVASAAPAAPVASAAPNADAPAGPEQPADAPAPATTREQAFGGRL